MLQEIPNPYRREVRDVGVRVVEGDATRPVADEEVRRVLGEVEPIDLNQSRNEIKPTTWHIRS